MLQVCDGWRLFQNKPVEIVLTDIQMPGLDGIELSKRIRNQSPHTKIAVMTGGNTDIAAELLNDGTATFLFKKPFAISCVCKSLLSEAWMAWSVTFIEHQQTFNRARLLTLTRNRLSLKKKANLKVYPIEVTSDILNVHLDHSLRIDWLALVKSFYLKWLQLFFQTITLSYPQSAGTRIWRSSDTLSAIKRTTPFLPTHGWRSTGTFISK